MNEPTDERNFTQEQARSMYRGLTLIAFPDPAWSAETLQEIARDYVRLIDNDPCPDCGKIPCACGWGIEISISTDDTPKVVPEPTLNRRYIWERHETSRYRFCVLDTETNTRLMIPGEQFLWTTLPRVKREIARLNTESESAS